MILLNCIISKMYEPVGEVLHVELFACRADISILIPVSFQVSVDWSDEHVCSQVEFTLLVQVGNNILLDDMCPFLSFIALSILPKDTVYLLNCLYHHNTIPSVCVLSWFYKPGISPLRLETVLWLVVYAGFSVLLLLFYLFISLVILLQKIEELFILFLFYVKGHWDVVEWVLLSALIVSL